MIKTDIHGDIGVISVDRPPVNAINPELVSSLTESLDSFNNNELCTNWCFLSYGKLCYVKGLKYIW